MAKERLDYLNRRDIVFQVAEQKAPTETYWIV